MAAGKREGNDSQVLRKYRAGSGQPAFRDRLFSNVRSRTLNVDVSRLRNITFASNQTRSVLINFMHRKSDNGRSTG